MNIRHTRLVDPVMKRVGTPLRAPGRPARHFLLQLADIWLLSEQNRDSAALRPTKWAKNSYLTASSLTFYCEFIWVHTYNFLMNYVWKLKNTTKGWLWVLGIFVYKHILCTGLEQDLCLVHCDDGVLVLPAGPGRLQPAAPQPQRGRGQLVGLPADLVHIVILQPILHLSRRLKLKGPSVSTSCWSAVFLREFSCWRRRVAGSGCCLPRPQ